MALQRNLLTMHKSVSASFALASNDIKINKKEINRQINKLDQARESTEMHRNQMG